MQKLYTLLTNFPDSEKGSCRKVSNKSQPAEVPTQVSSGSFVFRFLKG